MDLNVKHKAERERWCVRGWEMGRQSEIKKMEIERESGEIKKSEEQKEKATRKEE